MIDNFGKRDRERIARIVANMKAAAARKRAAAVDARFHAYLAAIERDHDARRHAAERERRAM